MILGGSSTELHRNVAIVEDSMTKRRQKRPNIFFPEKSLREDHVRVVLHSFFEKGNIV